MENMGLVDFRVPLTADLGSGLYLDLTMTQFEIGETKTERIPARKVHKKKKSRGRQEATIAKPKTEAQVTSVWARENIPESGNWQNLITNKLSGIPAFGGV
jgi:hypothetical protein